MVHTHLLLLRDEEAGPPVLLETAADGSILTRGSQPRTTTARRVLAVPGQDCRMLRLRLPARSALQARAAAHLMLREHLADDPEALHVAVGAADADAQRWVVAVSPDRVRGWLDRARALGFDAQAMVPTPLLLQPPPGDAVRTTDCAGLRLARGEDLCFAAEPELAERLLTGRAIEHAADAQAALARGAVAPAVDLLQGAFAAAAERPEGWHAWRRAAVLAALVLLSPLLLLAATVLRDRLAADRAAAQAAELARTALPALPASADPPAAVRAQLEAMRGADRFAHATAALLTAVSGVDDAELDALSWSDGALGATLSLAGPGDLQRLRTALAADGLELVGDATAEEGRGGYRIALRPLR